MTVQSFPERARPNGWWGMLLLVATEASLFGTLVASYFYLRFRTVDWPPAGVAEPKVLIPCALTAVLVLTSLPMWYATRAVLNGRRSAAILGLLVSFVLASMYLVLQVNELRKAWADVAPQDNAYGSLYYTLTGAHAAHVAAGLLVNLWLVARVARGLNDYRGIGVWATALYWHFVNVLAVVVLLTTISPSL